MPAEIIDLAEISEPEEITRITFEDGANPNWFKNFCLRKEDEVRMDFYKNFIRCHSEYDTVESELTETDNDIDSNFEYDLDLFEPDEEPEQDKLFTVSALGR